MIIEEQRPWVYVVTREHSSGGELAYEVLGVTGDLLTAQAMAVEDKPGPDLVDDHPGDRGLLRNSTALGQDGWLMRWGEPEPFENGYVYRIERYAVQGAQE